MDEHISVREWQERFRTGTFANAEQAGWEDFYDPLNNRRLQALARLVMGITDPFILDHYYLWFKDNTPGVGRRYGDVRFMPLDEDAEKYFLVPYNSPHERTKWALITKRFGYGSPEFECGTIRSMIRYINQLGPELEQGIKPIFIAERFAVEVYALICGEPSCPYVYREGEHRYSYTSFRDKQQHLVMTSTKAEDVPPGLKSEKIKGIHVWPVDEAEKKQPQPQQKPHKSCKRQEAER